MPKFGKKSQNMLDTCEPKLRQLFAEVIKHYDCTILEGHRTKERQGELFKQGKTKLQSGGKHTTIPSCAVDVAPYPVDWDDTKRFYHFAGFVQATATQLGISIRWGGDWDSDKDLKDQSFFDLVHFELI